jgi:hypothetical protein
MITWYVHIYQPCFLVVEATIINWRNHNECFYHANYALEMLIFLFLNSFLILVSKKLLIGKLKRTTFFTFFK